MLSRFDAFIIIAPSGTNPESASLEEHLRKHIHETVRAIEHRLARPGPAVGNALRGGPERAGGVVDGCSRRWVEAGLGALSGRLCHHRGEGGDRSGKVFDPGTIVVRRGVIEAVGLTKDVTVPYDAETIDGKGLVVYPGFIDLYSTAGQRAGVERSATGKGRPVDLAEAPLSSTPPDNRRGLTPEFEVAGALELPDALAEPRRRLGFTDFLSAPVGAIATGQSALVSLSGLPRREVIVSAPVALHVNLAPPTEPAAAAGPATPRSRADAGPRASSGAGRPGRRGARRKPLSARADGLDRAFPPGDARQRAFAEARCLLRIARRGASAGRSRAQGASGREGQEAAGLVGSEHSRRDSPGARSRRGVRDDRGDRRRP